MVNTILAKRGNHIVAKGGNPVWPKGSKSRGFSSMKRKKNFRVKCCSLQDLWNMYDIEAKVTAENEKIMAENESEEYGIKVKYERVRPYIAKRRKYYNSFR